MFHCTPHLVSCSPCIPEGIGASHELRASGGGAGIQEEGGVGGIRWDSGKLLFTHEAKRWGRAGSCCGR